MKYFIKTDDTVTPLQTCLIVHPTLQPVPTHGTVRTYSLTFNTHAQSNYPIMHFVLVGDYRDHTLQHLRINRLFSYDLRELLNSRYRYARLSIRRTPPITPRRHKYVYGPTEVSHDITDMVSMRMIATQHLLKIQLIERRDNTPHDLLSIATNGTLYTTCLEGRIGDIDLPLTYSSTNPGLRIS